MRKVDPLNAMAIGCVVIAALVEAAQQALTGAPKVSAVLPTFLISPNVNYIPLILLSISGLLWVIKHSRPDRSVLHRALPTPQEKSASTSSGTPLGGVLFPIKVTLGPAPQIFVSHMSIEFGTLRDGYIHINITFVCCATGFSLEKIPFGSISMKMAALVADPQIPASQPTRLDPPHIEAVSALSATVLPEMLPRFTVHRGVGVVHLKQYVSPNVGAAITAALFDPKRGLNFIYWVALKSCVARC
jgi:hypothetical protein